MAQIILDVNTQKAVANLKQLQNQVSIISKSLSSTKVNENLTKQLNALSRALNASSKATQGAAKADKLKAEAAKEAAKAEKIKAQTAKESKEETKELSKETDTLTQSTKRLDDATKDASKNIAKWISNLPTKLLKSFSKELEETLTKTENTVVELKRVLNEDISSNAVSDKLYDLAIQYGQSFENASTISANFAKSGKDWNETIKATEAALLAMNVAELSAEESSSGLIAIMNQFGYEAESLTHVIDLLNKTSDSAPVTTEKLLQGLQKAGSYARQANLSLEETVAILTTLSGTTGASGQALGTAAKSLFAYTTKDSALNVYSSLSDNMNRVVTEYKKGAASILDVWQQLSNELQHLTNEQADKLAEYAESQEGQEMEAALGEELSEIYDSMTGVYDTAGTYRKNYFIALMKNFDDVQEALSNVQDVEGYSQQENLLYMDTYTAKVNSLNAEWEKFLTNGEGFLEFKKNLADLGAGFLKILNYIGGVRTVAFALLTLALRFKGLALIQGVKKFATGIKDNIKVFSNYVKEAKKAKAAGDQLAMSQAQLSAAMNIGVSVAGTVITAISAIVGAYQSYREEQKKAREEAIQEGLAQEEKIQNLTALYTKYKNLGSELSDNQKNTKELDGTTNEYLNTEQELANVLGDKVKTLGDLKSGTDEYAKSIENLTKEELKNSYQKASGARMAAKKELNERNLNASWRNEYLLGDSSGDDDEGLSIVKDLDQYLVFSDKSEERTNGAFRGVKGKNALESYLNASAILDYLDARPDIKEKNPNSYNYILGVKTEAKKRIDEYIKTATQEKSIEAILGGKDISNENVQSDIINEILQNANVSSNNTFFRDLISEELKNYSIYGNNGSSEINSTGSSENGASGGSNNDKSENAEEEFRKSLLEGIKELCDNTKQTNTLEEKQADILEKQEALKKAESQRTVRVFNQETGHFEMAANPKDVEAAKEALEKSKTNLANYVEEQTKSKLSSMEDFSIEDAMSIIGKGIKDIGDWADPKGLLDLRNSIWEKYDQLYVNKVKKEASLILASKILGSKSDYQSLLQGDTLKIDKNEDNNTKNIYYSVNGVKIEDPEITEKLIQLFSKLGMDSGE